MIGFAGGCGFAAAQSLPTAVRIVGRLTEGGMDMIDVYIAGFNRGLEDRGGDDTSPEPYSPYESVTDESNAWIAGWRMGYYGIYDRVDGETAVSAGTTDGDGYKIIKTKTTGNLEYTVNRHIKAGWSVVGSICVLPNGDVCQTLTKELDAMKERGRKVAGSSGHRNRPAISKEDDDFIEAMELDPS